MKKIIIIGAGGNGKVIASNIDDIKKKNKIELFGFLDDNKKSSKNCRILGKITANNIKTYLLKKNIYFIYSLFSTKLKKNSAKKLELLKIPHNRFINLIHPNVSISNNVKIGHGVNICSYVNISPNVKIGNHVNIFSQSMVGHDTILENYSYLANNSVLGAQIKVKEGAYIGMNATIRENIQIGKWSTVGMGSVVLKNINNFETVVGNPAKKIEK